MTDFTGWPMHQIRASWLPPEWLGDVVLTHRAVDDARGYAHLLTVVLGEPPEPAAG